MATGMYASTLEQFLTGQRDWLTDTLRVVIVDHAEYTPNLATDSSLADIPVLARVAISAVLTGKTATGGVADAANVTFSELTGAVSEGVVVYVDSGVENTSYLLCHIDEGASFPITPTGADFTLEWDATNGVFKL